MQNSTIHFIGIGGIGMSALAQLYHAKGATVTGSDRDSSRVTALLESKGIRVLVGHETKNVPENATLVVYSDAVPEDNPERKRAVELGIKTGSYFEALGEATKEGTSIVVAGTHGKTSTTAMIAKILIDFGERPTVIAGSILREYNSNFVEGRNDLFVIEGCEYRRHFLHLHPNILVITNIELDHTDYFKDFADMQDAFKSVVARVPKGGTVVTDTTDLAIETVLNETNGSVSAYQNTSIPKLSVVGEFNKKNARAAKAAVRSYLPEAAEVDIDTSLKAFSGTWRRFEYKGKTVSGAAVYDDYAHHPTAVEGTIKTVQDAFPDKHALVVFHPHLYSRTKAFFAEFAQALAQADEVIVLPIYAAREKEDPAVNSDALSKAIIDAGGNAAYIETFSAVEQILKKKGSETVIITMGAGDVYKIGDEIAKK